MNFSFQLVLLSRVNRIEKSIKIFLVFETVSKIVLIVSNCLQLNQFSCMSKQNSLSRWIDQAFGMECSGAWLMTNLSNIGMTGLTVFSMLSGLFRCHGFDLWKQVKPGFTNYQPRGLYKINKETLKFGQHFFFQFFKRFY